MKFSPQKKAKMKKIRLKRIKKCGAYSVGDSVYLTSGSKKYYRRDIQEFIIEDRTKLRNDLYLLVRSFYTDKHYIFKAISDCCDCTKISPKKLEWDKTYFEKTTNWERKSKVGIDPSGAVWATVIVNNY